MLSKANRLPLRTEFKRVKSAGKFFSSNSFSLILNRKDADVPLRFGFVVSKKVAAMAVDRNRIRRKLTEALRPHLTHLPAGIEGIFLAKPAAGGKSVQELSSEMAAVFGKTGVL